MGLLPPDSRHADPVIQRLLDWLRGQTRQTGRVTVTWAGASAESDAPAVSHDLGRAGKLQLTPTSRAAAAAIAAWGSVPTTSGFSVRARTLDGSVPVNGTTATVDWEIS